MADPTRVLLTALLVAALSAIPAALAPPVTRAVARISQEEPTPVPFIEREEVRFVILDIIAEVKARGWRPLRDLTIGEIEVRVGGRLMSVDQFEDYCLSGPTFGAPPESESTSLTGSAGGDRFILYFDMEHLNLAGRDVAFKAAQSWAADRLAPADEVMIITAGRGLAMSYTEIDRSKTRNSLENMPDMMTIFDTVAGTKNLVLFADTIRLIPGRQYGITANPPIDVSTQLQSLAEAANERNVRIYPAKAGLWVPFGGGDPLADDAMTMLASETGGRVFEGSNAVDGVFDRVGEDLSCFYRVGFRIRPRYSGKVEPIRVRIGERGCRLKSERRSWRCSACRCRTGAAALGRCGWRSARVSSPCDL